MAESRLLCFFSGLMLLCFFSTRVLLSEGLPDVVQTQQTVTAAVGGDALFCCQLLQPKDVWQVTWQKLSSTGDGREGSWRDLASFNRYFGQWVNAKFSGKVAFRDASLQNCSIVLRRVQVEDEGCYRCLFNIDPEGVFTGRTCLQLHELQAPLLQVGGPGPAGGPRVVRCVATGRPAPTVTLSATQQGLRLSNHSRVTVSNPNGSVSVNSSALLWGSPPHGGIVGCAAQQQSGPQLHTFVTLPEVGEPSGEEEEPARPSHSNESSWVALLLAVSLALLSLISILVAVVLVLRRERKNRRDSQRNSTPAKEAQPLIGTNQTPLRQPDRDSLKQRTPSFKTTVSRVSRVSRELFSQKENFGFLDYCIKIWGGDDNSRKSMEQ
ncbi:OX-2 membrane glycoprotein-like [Salarias fasciatus]|uniref:OX-2 membrane glycoprotein-like n=1 Tax=Salarias fasciatus TaxID=181472 RepID=UPI001176CA98|nr:OX-2 membrane glycoprotein-like [Salarias fasciatus]